MAIVHRLLAPVVEVRQEESGTLLLMFLYSFLAMTAYNILKPLAAGVFIGAFGADNLPFMILVAGPLIAGIMQVYTAGIARLPNRWVIQITQLVVIVLLVGYSVLFRTGVNPLFATSLYLFRLILGVLLLSQFWTLANDIYDPRQAKRFFGFIGGGGALGGLAASFLVQQTVDQVGLGNLLLVSAGVVACCLVIVTTVLTRSKDVGLKDITSAGAKKGVAWNESWTMLRQSPHLQVIAGVIALAAMGAALVEQQLGMAVEEFVGEGAGADARIAELLATVQLFTSTISFIVQIWLTARIHRYLGIGVALLLLPIGLGGTAIAMLLSQQLWSAMLAKTVDTSLRYSVDKTSREILFMPLPSELKYQAKPFVDVTVDSLAKSAVNILILVLVQPWGLALGWPSLSVASLILLVGWIYMSIQARTGYLEAFQRSIEQRDVQPAEVRLDVADLSTVETLVEELAHPDEGRVLYAIDMLESLDKRNLVTPLLLHHASAAVRERALSAIGSARPEIARRWATVIQGMISDDSPDVRAAAIGALAKVNDQDASAYARTLLADTDPRIVATAAVVLSQSGDAADQESADHALSALAAAAGQSDPRARRDLAAAIRQVANADCRHILIPLLHDADPSVAAEAMRSVRALPATDSLFAPTLISLLGHRQLKSGARETLVGYGEPAIAMLGHFLSDANEDIWVRRHIPATLARIPHQASMDLLIAGLDQADGFLRYKVLSAIQKLSRANPELTFKPEPLEVLALRESRAYCTALTLHYNLFVREGLPTSSTLALTLTQKLRRNVDRIYRLLGLLYPWKDIAAARWAIERGSPRARASAFEYLDTILTTQLRSRLMPVLEDMPLGEKVRRANLILRTRPRNVEETLLQLINDDNPVVAAAAIDLIREQRLWSLSDDIDFVLEHRDPTDWYVFEAASWTLASQHLTSERRRELWLEPLPAVALVERLRGLPMFASVSIDELFRIAGTGQQTRHETATTLLHEGAVPDALYVLLDGRVVSTTRHREPRDISPPVTLGFDELLKGNLMAHTVKTLEPCVTLRLSVDQMGTLLADDLDLVQGLFRTLASGGMTDGRAILEGHLDGALVGPGREPLTPIQKALAMQRVPVFSRLSATEMRHLAGIAHQVDLSPDAIVSGETDPPVVWVVLSGTLAVEAPGNSDPPGLAQPGDVVGLLEVLAGQAGDTGREPRQLRVLQAGAALRIDREDLYDLLGQRSDLLQQIFRALFGERPR